MGRTHIRARTTLLVTALTVAASGAGASVAAASAPPNPVYGGSGGACNMINPPPAPHMLSNPVQQGPGLAGMFNAMFHSAGVSDGNCLPTG
jgi:hypothetical protein